MLSPLAARVLDSLGESEKSTSALIEAMELHLVGASGVEVSDLIDEVVDGLSRIGVIETLEEAS